jgi:hypothetical protein
LFPHVPCTNVSKGQKLIYDSGIKVSGNLPKTITNFIMIQKVFKPEFKMSVTSLLFCMRIYIKFKVINFLTKIREKNVLFVLELCTVM